MRYKTIVAASAAAAAAAIPCGAAAASTPDWLALASLETGNPSPLPVVCGEEPTGTVLDPACAGIFGTGQYDDEAFGVPLPQPPPVPQSPQTYDGLPALANVDLRDSAKWEVCGVSAGSTTADVDCDNSTTAAREPVGSENGLSLLNVDASGALNWSVCGVAVLAEVYEFNC
ncbi:hypothetical protein [Glycomyces arizonensis]|uniref:hypothetical protein n=1 Tax=Glycomyces arizonensis TaxID=256035 RepID=UPI000406FEC6|nr:hypothetical protein [Glycomyces arizonensis]